MQIRLGYELVYDCPQSTPMLLMLNVHHMRHRYHSARPPSHHPAPFWSGAITTGLETGAAGSQKSCRSNEFRPGMRLRVVGDTTKSARLLGRFL